MTPAALETLEELDVDSLSALREADTETVDALRDADSLPDQLQIRILGLHEWAGGDEVVFEDRAALEARAALAREGYRAHR